jgi:cation diffusion facilitator family transporter
MSHHLSGSRDAIKSDIALYGALAANIGIAVAKFIAAAVSGSSSMLTEGIHSLVDSGNQILLLYGQRQAKRRPDALHPFGYGRELYFWAFVVAILIFAVGAGVSVYEGVRHIRAPEPLADPLLNYVVLASAAIMEGASWAVAVREFSAKRKGTGWWRAVRRSKDPAGFIVLFEDSAALMGLALAGVGVWASHAYGYPAIDGFASIAIGLILAFIATLLACETKGLLIGESADGKLVSDIWDVIGRERGVTAINHVRTIHTSPDAVFAAISADFDDGLSVGSVETLIKRLEQDLKRIYPELTSIYIRPENPEFAVRLARPVVSPASG